MREDASQDFDDLLDQAVPLEWGVWQNLGDNQKNQCDDSGGFHDFGEILSYSTHRNPTGNKWLAP